MEQDHVHHQLVLIIEPTTRAAGQCSMVLAPYASLSGRSFDTAFTARQSCQPDALVQSLWLIL